MIPKADIENILRNIDIVDVIGDRIQIKSKGKNYMGLCPFHNEKSPSFSVSQSKQFYYCFGCGASGDAISFLVEYENMRFVEVVEYLASQAGVSINKEPVKEVITNREIDEYKELRMFKAIFEAAINNGERATLKEKRHYRFACARIKVIEEKGERLK